MTIDEFEKYIPILKQEPFYLTPDPGGIDRSQNRFVYEDHNETHVTIKCASIDKRYLLPIILIELANPGVMSLAKKVRTTNGSFV